MDANIKNLRDALEWLDRDIEGEAVVDGEMSTSDAIRVGFIRNMLKKFPLRNCDMGTPKDQLERFSAFCDQFDADCTGCPCDGNACTLGACFATWAQMPYAAERKGES